ncbi:MAG: SDR family NAD(P)-dependent oxidoreductase [Alphaproteobacteria bacterium]
MRNQVVSPKDGVAWVTGASSGIGRDTAIALCAEGWRVAGTARREKDLQDLADEVKDLPGSIHPYAADVTDRSAMAGVVEAIEADQGPLALVILNAGIYLPLEVPEFDAEIFEKSFSVNVLGTAYGLESVIPRMIGRSKGHIAMVSSVTGYGGLPTSAAYGATKAALINMAEAMKIELDRHGVRVSIINPGFVETPAQDDNAFPKPFMIPSKKAADLIVKGLKRQAFEITFPKIFTYQLKILKWLPRDWYIALIKRQTGWV